MTNENSTTYIYLKNIINRCNLSYENKFEIRFYQHLKCIFCDVHLIMTFILNYYCFNFCQLNNNSVQKFLKTSQCRFYTKRESSSRLQYCRQILCLALTKHVQQNYISI